MAISTHSTLIPAYQRQRLSRRVSAGAMEGDVISGILIEAGLQVSMRRSQEYGVWKCDCTNLPPDFEKINLQRRERLLPVAQTEPMVELVREG